MWIRIVAAATLALLSACGGGSGGGDSGSSSGGGSSVFTLSSRSVSLSAATGASAPIVHVALTVTNPPAASFYYGYSWNGTAAASVAMSWTSDTSADISIQGWPPGQLGAGNFTDTVTIELCSDSACTQQLAGSPAAIAVSYQVTGAALPDTTFLMHTASSYAYNLYSTDTVAALNLYVEFTHIPPAGVGLLYGSDTGELIEDVSFTQTSSNADGSGTGTITLTLRQPANMAPGDYTDRFSLYVCFDSACTQYSQDSPQSVDLSYRVYATAGRDYQLNELSASAATRLAYASNAGLLYLQGPVAGIAAVNGIVAVDPAGASAAGTWTTTQTVADLALSSDETYLYVLLSFYDGTDTQWTLVRLIRSTLTQDMALSLGANQNSFQVYTVPGAPHAIAVVSNKPLAHSLTVYDDLVARSQAYLDTSANGGCPGNLWAPDGTHVYSYVYYAATLCDFTISSSGVAGPTTSTVDFSVDGAASAGQMMGPDGLLYTYEGLVYDPLNRTFATPFSRDTVGTPFILTPEPANDRAWWTVIEGGSNVLRRYVMSTRALLGIMPMPSHYAYIVDAQRWGTNGYAVLSSNGYLGLFQGDFFAP